MYRDPGKPDYLLFVEHFADQAAYDAHTSSPAYQELIAGQFANMIVEFVFHAVSGIRFSTGVPIHHFTGMDAQKRFAPTASIADSGAKSAKSHDLL